MFTPLTIFITRHFENNIIDSIREVNEEEEEIMVICPRELLKKPKPLAKKTFV